MKYIELTKGKVTAVDDADFETFNKFKWHINTMGYAARRIGHRGSALLLHREILNVEKGMCVDHINRNKLDNRRQNLRTATYGQNGANRIKKKNSVVKYKGVSLTSSGKYEAKFYTNKKNIYLGTFCSAVNAALAYDKKAKEIYGDYALLNFPDSWFES